MKKLILITLVLTLAMGTVWLPSIAAADTYPITIHKTIPAGGPAEAFTFEAYRDMNNNGIIDFVDPWPDVFVGEVEITGAGTGVINSAILGKTIIHEVLIPGSAYQQLPDQIVQVSCPVEVTFDNEVQVQELGELVILKQDGSGSALADATFVITPNPKTGADSLTVIDNGLNDEAPAEGVLGVTDCLVCITCTVTETVAPPGYTVAPPQTAHVTTAGETVELTFINEKLPPDICIEKLVDCNDDGEYLDKDVGSYGDTPSWYIKVSNCGESLLLNVMVSDANGKNWGPFGLDIGEEWEVTYEGDPIYETTTNTAEAIAEDVFGGTVGPVYDSATNVIEIEPCIEILKLVDCNDDGEYLPVDIGTAGDVPSWYIEIHNCGDSPLHDVYVSDDYGPGWGPFDLAMDETWSVTYDHPGPVYEDTTNEAMAVGVDVFGGTVGPVYCSATNVVPSEICVLIADEDFIDNDGQAIQEAAKSHGVRADKMINDTGYRPTLDPSDGTQQIQVPTEIDNPWFLWNEEYFGDVVLLETGQVKDEGLFCLTDEALAELEKRGYSLEDFIYGRIPQSALDKVPGVMPLRNDCLRALVGQTCIVVVYDSDISINYKPINANLQGARLGLTYLEFLDVVNPGTIKESTDSTSLLDIWVEVLPIPELPDPFPTETNCECVVQDQEPPDVSIKTAEWDNGTLTVEVEAKLLEGSSAKPVLNASYGKLKDNYPGINNGTTSETLIPVETPWTEIDKGIYRLMYSVAQNIQGWTITVSSSWGGAYNAEMS